jgi:hypothetical protein
MSRFPVNNAPYYDDFNEDAHFARVLFKPGVAVQARELTQLQSILQNQIERFGKHVFIEGSQVIPGNINIDYNVAYVHVVQSTAVNMSTEAEIEAYWLNQKVTCIDSTSLQKGVTGIIFDYDIPATTLPDTVTLFIKYTTANNVTENPSVTCVAPSVTNTTVTITSTPSSNTANYQSGYAKFTTQSGAYDYYRRITNYNALSKIITLDSAWDAYAPDSGSFYLYPTNSGTIKTFADSDQISLVDTPTTTANVVSTSGTGQATISSVDKGIYFTHGKFAQVEAQTIIVSPSTDTPNCRVGLSVTEYVVTAAEDSTLYDNSLGTTNSAAPGADRLKIDLTLTTLDLDTIGTIDEEDFIELIRIENGTITKKIDGSVYSVLNKTLARRTYDESGDYTVRYFPLTVKPFFDESTTGGTGEVNNGVYKLSDFEYDTAAEAETVSLNTFERKNSITLEPEAASHEAASGKYRPGADTNDLLSLVRSRMAVILDPGKAYVKGYEVETISKTYLSIAKALAYKYTSSTLNCNIGNYIRATNSFAGPDVSSLVSLTLHSSYNITPGSEPSTTSAIGTANAACYQYSTGTLGGAGAVYKLKIFNTQMTGTSTLSDVKSISSAGSVTFTADVFNATDIIMPGSMSFNSGESSITGADTFWLTDSDPFKRLYPGDVLVSLTSNKGDSVLGGGELIVTSVETDTAASVVTSTSAECSAAPFYKKLSGLKTAQSPAIYIYELPQVVRSIQDEYGHLQSEYIAQMLFKDVTIADGSGSIALSSNSIFSTPNNSNYCAFCITSTTGTLAAGDSIDLSSALTLANSSKNLDIDLGASLTSGTIDIYCAVEKNGYTGYGSMPTPGSQYKSKTLVNDTSVTTALNDTNIGTVSLNRCDIKAINAIYMSSSFSVSANTSDTNITDRYELDNGQRDTHYANGSISLKPGYAFPTGTLLIDFDYYTHAAGGGGSEGYNYLCANSNGYEQDYESKNMGYTYDLSNCIDFRPRMADGSTNFTGSNAIPTSMPLGSFYTVYSYYLNRIDKIYVNPDGTFKISKGVDDIFPEPPDDPTQGMVLYNLNVAANTQDENDVYPDFIENKRFTMRDIGKLEKRIQNVEYYTNLNQLENSVVNMNIVDSDGNQRYKNGFVAENFSNGFALADTQNVDLKGSVSFDDAEWIAQFIDNNIELIEKDADTQTATTRSANGYQITGNLVTLPYTETTLIDQPVASHSISVNPFNTISFYGYVYLTPDKDTWKDTVTIAPLNITDTSAYDSIVADVNARGTIYGDWTNTGQPTVSKSKEILKRTTEYGGNSADAVHSGNWPYRTVTKKRVTTTTSQDQTRTVKTPVVTAVTRTQSLGDRVVDVSYIPYMRSRVVSFEAKGLKPNTKVIPFFDDKNVESFCYNTNLVPDSSGSLTGSLIIPGARATKYRDLNSTLTDAEKALRIKTGIRQFVLTDDENNGANWDSKAQATFFAEGLRETKQETILSTKTAQVSYIDAEENRTINDVTSKVVTKTSAWKDPLAETFMVPKDGGCFVTSIDLYFAAKDENLPVSIEIRNVVNGYPGQMVVPYSQVYLNPDQVNVSEDASLATSFTMHAPVYLQDETEYCFVVMSNSDDYECYIATMGLDPATGHNYTKIGTDIPISANPYTGVFFKSQNASTWTADQYTDIKFKIKCAEFSASRGTVQFTNDTLPAAYLNTDPIQTGDGTGIIRVHHRSHGMCTDLLTPRRSYVSLTGITSEVNGISADMLNGTHTIHDFVDLDSYTIDLENEYPDSFVSLTGEIGASASLTQIVLTGGLNVDDTYNDMTVKITDGLGVGQVRRITNWTGSTTTAEVTAFTTSVTEGDAFKVYRCRAGYGGGSNVTATENYQMDLMRANVAQLILPNTNISWAAKTTSGKSPNGTEQPYNLSAYNDILANQDTVFAVPQLIASEVNEQSDSFFVGGVNTPGKSLIVKAQLSSSNDYLSPVIDMSELNVTAIGHRVDYPTEATTSVTQLDKFELAEIPTYGYAIDAANSRITLPSQTTGMNAGTFAAVAGGGNTAYTLAATASTTDNVYVGLNLYNNGEGEARQIVSYTGSSKVATVSPAFSGSATATYIIGIPEAKESLFTNLSSGDILHVSGAASSTANTQYIVSSAEISSSVTTADAGQVLINLRHAPSVSELSPSAGAMRVHKLEKFKPEIAPYYASGESRYVMQRFILAEPSTALKIFVGAMRVSGSDIKVYYRTLKVGDNTTFDDLVWHEASLDREVSASPDDSVFRDYEYTINNLDEFTAAQVKVALKGDDTANSPRLKDVRVIALDL